MLAGALQPYAVTVGGTPGVADQVCAANAAGDAANAAELEGQTDCSATDSAEG